MTAPVSGPRRDPAKVVVYRDRGTGQWLVSVHACWTIPYRTWRDAMDHAVGPAPVTPAAT